MYALVTRIHGTSDSVIRVNRSENGNLTKNGRIRTMLDIPNRTLDFFSSIVIGIYSCNLLHALGQLQIKV